jgi:hypothetical protein
MKRYFKEINKYSSQDIFEWKHTNIGALYVKIYNNIPTFELLYIKGCDRAESIKKIILETLKNHKINNVEIFINLMDNPINNKYFLQFSSTTNCNINTIPNFSFYQWKDTIMNKSDINIKTFFHTKQEILSNKTDWNNKINKIMWSGVKSNIIRERMNVLKTNDRYEYNLIESYSGSKHKFYDLKDHGNYKYLLDLEGIGYSGRFPYLALTGSCVILLENTHPDRNFKLYYDEYFQENIHYIKVKYDSNTTIDEINNMIIKKIDELPSYLLVSLLLLKIIQDTWFQSEFKSEPEPQQLQPTLLPSPTQRAPPPLPPQQLQPTLRPSPPQQLQPTLRPSPTQRAPPPLQPQHRAPPHPTSSTQKLNKSNQKV